MNQKGMSLLEVVCAISLAGIILVGAVPSIRLLDHIRFNQLVSEVYTGVKNAQQMAHLLNASYVVSQDGEFVHVKNTLKSDLEHRFKIPDATQVFIGSRDLSSKFDMKFTSDMSPDKAGTITLTNTRIKKKVQMTVLVATGKVTIYEYDLE